MFKGKTLLAIGQREIISELILMELVSAKGELSEMTSGMLIERVKKKEHLER